MRECLPGAIYLGHNIKFTAPVMADNEVTATMTVEKIREDKKIVTFQTTLFNNDTDKVAIKGEGTFIIPHLKTREIELPSEKVEEAKEEETVEEEPQNIGESFENYSRITDKTKEVLEGNGIRGLFPIQSATFDSMYDGKDHIARDLTGTGKTLAFSLPLVERFRQQGYFEDKKGTRCIILTPTRELAIQVSKQIEMLKHSRGEFNVATIYGGVSYTRQVDALNRGVEFIVATTGRMIDHIKNRTGRFENVEAVILDEADRMLDMGFQDEVEHIIEEVKLQKQAKPQVILFSATVPDWVKKIASKYLEKDYKFVDLVKSLKNKTAKSVEHISVQLDEREKIRGLSDLLSVHAGKDNKVIVFTQTKLEANKIVSNPQFKKGGSFSDEFIFEAIHGDVSQHMREITLKNFREGKCNVLVATDVASRGLDIPDVDLIIQMQPPNDIDSYIHRSGRTARAGKTGTCITLVSGYENGMLKNIERAAGIKFKQEGLPDPKQLVTKQIDNLEHALTPVEPQI